MLNFDELFIQFSKLRVPRYALSGFIRVVAVSIMDYPVHVEICEVLIIVLFAPIEALRISWGNSLIQM